MRLELVVNGVRRALEVEPLRRLLDVLREDLGLTGTKEGCGEGECGACTVLVDGEALNSCLLPVCQVRDCDVLTIEGAGLERVQQAFLEQHGTQCGICTPGLVLMSKAYLDDCARAGVTPDRAGVRRAIAGNLCRCTGYEKVVLSVLAAAEGGA